MYNFTAVDLLRRELNEMKRNRGCAIAPGNTGGVIVAKIMPSNPK